MSERTVSSCHQALQWRTLWPLRPCRVVAAMHQVVRFALMTTCYALVAWSTLMVTRASGGIATILIANATATVFALTRPARWRWWKSPSATNIQSLPALPASCCNSIKLMPEVRVVRRWPRKPVPTARPMVSSARATKFQVVGIGASTGGPPALQMLLAGLTKDFPVPVLVLVVQHITAGFLPGLAECSIRQRRCRCRSPPKECKL